MLLSHYSPLKYTLWKKIRDAALQIAAAVVT